MRYGIEQALELDETRRHKENESKMKHEETETRKIRGGQEAKARSSKLNAQEVREAKRQETGAAHRSLSEEHPSEHRVL